MSGTDVYTFGDGAAAASRLKLLAELYEEPTRALLLRWAPARAALAVDLGCGPGHPTPLLHEVLNPDQTVGVERSPGYAAAARAELAELPGVRIVGHDVTRPLPVRDADVVFARFLLTHLAAPVAALRTWAASLACGGRLVVQETARLTSRDPALGRYYELVAELQRRHGQPLDVGSRLRELAAEAGTPVVHAAIRPLRPKCREMAVVHVLNLRTWRNDPAAADFDADELDALDQALVTIARGGPAEPIEQELGELVVTAMPPQAAGSSA